MQRISKSLWVSDYASDIFVTMKESELRRRPLYFLSSQLDQRPALVQLCQLITRTYKLGRCALHLCKLCCAGRGVNGNKFIPFFLPSSSTAIYYLDCVIDFYTIRADKLQLVALICIHIAAQIESTDGLVPRYSEMNRLIQANYEPFEYKAVERKVLTFFNFELMRPTTASFVELFACSFLTRDDYYAYCKAQRDSSAHAAAYPRYNCFETMLASLAQLLLRMSDYTLCINRFRHEMPSFLVAICIAAVRELSGVPKRWTPYLTDLTSYTDLMVKPYVDLLRQYHYNQTTADLVNQRQQTDNVTSSTTDSGFEESLSVSQLEAVSVGIETINIITVKLPAKRGRVNHAGEEAVQQLKRSKLEQDEQEQ
ncbi:hypothetical protein KR222_008188, partial [Zaprionus bogoriensis]